MRPKGKMVVKGFMLCHRYFSSVAHIDHLVNKGSSTPAFLLKEQTVRESGEALCTVCKKLLKSETHLRVHLKIHMREAHQETKECAKCDAVFEST